MASPRIFVEDLLKKADVTVGGDRSQDIVVHDERLFGRVIRYGTLGLGEAYMDGWWDANSLDTFIATVLRAGLERKFELNFSSVATIAKAFLFNLQSSSRAFRVGEAHYDLGNDLYGAMLDKRLVYTCGYWSSPSTGSGRQVMTLDEAQEAKLDLVCRKIGLKKGDRVLDIGCGWGSFAKYAAEKYGASVVGVTVSKEQAALAQERCAGLPVEIRVQDYRDLDPSTDSTGSNDSLQASSPQAALGAGEPFDHIVSLGMFEHVGVKNYRTYFEVARRCLKPNGLFLLHTIGGNVSRLTSDPWITKYIFPGGVIPSAAQIAKASEGLFVMEDWHNFGTDYDRTLMAWFKNFDAAWVSPSGVEGPTLREKYGDRFYRMWKYYLLSCAGVFRARETQLWQIVLSPSGVPGGYQSVR